MTTPQVDEEAAFHFIVKCLRDKPASASKYGYAVYLPKIIDDFLSSVHGIAHADATTLPHEVSPAFYNAAWELARRGILRPGVVASRSQVTDDGSGGAGYSLTPHGRKWIAESGQYDFVPTDPGRFSRQLATFAPRFGDGFQERSQEAIRCYAAPAHLACCVMCGAAAESILLSIAVAKTGNAPKVEKEYLASGGRGRIEKQILASQSSSIQEEFRGYTSLLKYWRDNAAHGHRLGLGDNEAYTSLAVLLRFAQFASDRWSELVGAAAL